MASESGDSASVTVSLPPDLEEWLDRQATALQVDREQALLQLLAAYRAADDAATGDIGDLLAPEDVRPLVREVIEDLRREFEDLRSEYRETLEDVRHRVVQLKRETDAKADADDVEADMDHLEQRIESLEAEYDRLTELNEVVDRLDRVEDELDRLDRVEDELDRLDRVEDELDRLDRVEDELDRLDGIERNVEHLDDARDKLQTVAYVVRDLRDTIEGGVGQEALERIKRQAAREDVGRGACGNCGEGVRIGLLTDPSCPHCDATLAGLEPSGRPFGLGSATLTVAAGLEASETATAADELDDISTANRGDRR